MSETGGAERRRHVRQRSLLAAKISYGFPPVRIDCTIRNLSAEGALVELAGDSPVPKSVQLLNVRAGLVYDATVVRQQGRRLGVHFEATHDLAGEVDLRLRPLQQLWKALRTASV